MKCGKVWISKIEDCDDNTNGYFCQVYTDADMEHEIDYFCIHTDDCDCTNEKEVDKFIEEYSKMYN
jgi:hypothetical protein